jgi:hypothetical protein
MEQVDPNPDPLGNVPLTPTIVPIAPEVGVI